MLPLILVGATLQRCDDCTALNAASAAEVTTLARERLFRDQLERDPQRKASPNGKVAAERSLPVCSGDHAPTRTTLRMVRSFLPPFAATGLSRSALPCSCRPRHCR